MFSVYYCKIDSGFVEDKVVFRPKVGPDPFYCSKGMLYSKEALEINNSIDIKEGCAIVFLNSLPHKFLKLTNIKDTP